MSVCAIARSVTHCVSTREKVDNLMEHSCLLKLLSRVFYSLSTDGTALLISVQRAYDSDRKDLVPQESTMMHDLTEVTGRADSYAALTSGENVSRVDPVNR